MMSIMRTSIWAAARRRGRKIHSIRQYRGGVNLHTRQIRAPGRCRSCPCGADPRQPGIPIAKAATVCTVSTHCGRSPVFVLVLRERRTNHIGCRRATPPRARMPERLILIMATMAAPITQAVGIRNRCPLPFTR